MVLPKKLEGKHYDAAKWRRKLRMTVVSYADVARLGEITADRVACSMLEGVPLGKDKMIGPMERDAPPHPTI